MKIIIKGIPMAKQSARFAVNQKAGFLMKYQDKDVVNWSNDAKTQICSQLPKDWKPIQDAVKIEAITFVFPPLKSFSKTLKQEYQNGILFKDTKPDIDNLLKNLWDACNGILWIDDRQVVELKSVRKIYGDVPRIEIEI